MKIFLSAMAMAACAVTPALMSPAWADAPLLPPRDASTGYFDGTALLHLCANRDDDHQAECLGYLEGTDDVVVAMRKAAHQPVCIPAGTSVEKIQDAVLTYILKTQAARAQDGGAVVAAAIDAAFPCAK